MPMTDSSLTWGAIIDALGGTGAVARSLSISSPTVSGWRTRGIPSMYWADLVAMPALPGEGRIVSLETLAALAKSVAEARA
ncbi:carph-isopro domain-containing protein [Bradyrhizobium sp. SZCCHNS3002]|uniref:carph-isopro domain-containing protein n=1 Tax=Bradyrhizobium sp. SZCCHNS3002 TaxID=3057310 RepID=UPI0039655F23